MYQMRIPKLFVRPGVGLLVGAVCATNWIIATSDSWARPIAQSFGQPSAAEAARFLQQSTWGPTPDLIWRVQAFGYERFLEDQFAAPMSSYPTLLLVPGTPPDDCPASTVCRRDNYTLYPFQTRLFT